MSTPAKAMSFPSFCIYAVKRLSGQHIYNHSFFQLQQSSDQPKREIFERLLPGLAAATGLSYRKRRNKAHLFADPTNSVTNAPTLSCHCPER
jgi:hypothetical protein